MFIPGALSSAEKYLREIQNLAPRRCIAISLRGCGKSDAPDRGYAFQDHVSDIRSVINESRLNSYCLVAYSMGVPFAIEQVATDATRAKGLVIGDYAARLPAIKPEWVEQSLQRPGANRKAILGLQRESTEIILRERLLGIECSVLVIRGGKPGSLLSNENADLYRQKLRDVVVVEFEDSDHRIFEPSYERYIGTIKDFLDRLDKRPANSMIV